MKSLLCACIFATGTLVSPSILRADEAAIPLSTASIIKDLEFDDVETTHILALKVEVDERPLYVEHALLLCKLKNAKWRLTNIYRHPKEKQEGFHSWKVAAVTDVPYTGSRDYDHKPTKPEVGKFLHDTWWKFEASRNFRLLQGKVYTEAWKESLGYEPEYRFPNPDVERKANTPRNADPVK